MEISVGRWYAAIARRHAERQFDASRPIPADMIASLQRTCTDFRPFPEARVELVTGAADRVFKGVLGPIGKVTGAPAYLAFIGTSQSPRVQEAVGYTGEGLVLEAVALGLGTCWISGNFRPDIAAAAATNKAGEKVLAVSPVGYPARQSADGRSHLRKPLAQMVTGLPEKDRPAWAGAALEAARLAPSAYNRQPWRFTVESSSVLVGTAEKTMERGTSLRLDCGIAMLHLELGARQQGAAGKWEIPASPGVARFKV